LRATRRTPLVRAALPILKGALAIEGLAPPRRRPTRRSHRGPPRGNAPVPGAPRGSPKPRCMRGTGRPVVTRKRQTPFFAPATTKNRGRSSRSA